MTHGDISVRNIFFFLPVCAVLYVFSHEIAIHAYETYWKCVAYESFLNIYSLSDDLMYGLFTQVLKSDGYARKSRVGIRKK